MGVFLLLIISNMIKLIILSLAAATALATPQLDFRTQDNRPKIRGQEAFEFRERDGPNLPSVSCEGCSPCYDELTQCMNCDTCSYYAFDSKIASTPKGTISIPYKYPMLQYLQEMESKYRDRKLSTNIVDFFKTLKNMLSDNVAKCTTCDLEGPANMTEFVHTSLSKEKDQLKIKAYFEEIRRELEKLDENIVIFVKI